MRMDSEMIGILLSDSMHYTIVVSLEMSDEPKIEQKGGLLVSEMPWLSFHDAIT